MSLKTLLPDNEINLQKLHEALAKNKDASYTQLALASETKTKSCRSLQVATNTLQMLKRLIEEGKK